MVNMTAEAGGDQKSTLKADIEDFVYKISAFALLQAVIIFAIGLGRGLDPLQIFVQGFIVVVVANIPQGLPTTITASLYIVAERMAKQRVFVKKLDVIETLGSVSLIATDKTGTLTLNQMQVSDVWLNGVSLTADDFLGGKADVEEQMYKIVGSQSASSPSVVEQDDSNGGRRGRVGEKQIQLFVETLSLNSRVQPDYSEVPLDIPPVSAPLYSPTDSSPVASGDKGIGGDGLSPCPKLLGDATEVGIYAFARRAIARLHANTPLADLETFRCAHPKQFEIQFNSQNKWYVRPCTYPCRESPPFPPDRSTLPALNLIFVGSFQSTRAPTATAATLG
jgi:magnesium-transporting ATPase (P-type)